MVRIGVYGGTFDPIHVGHLAAAETVREATPLDAVLFVPNWQQPLKPDAPQASGLQRLAMVQAAIFDNPAFAASDMELMRPGPSFTITTLDELRQQRPHDEICFILGADAANHLEQWRQPERIVEEYRPVVMLRAGWPGPDWAALERVHPLAKQLVRVVEVPALDIASSDLRARVAAGRSIRYLVPEAVRDVIEREGLYQVDGSSIPR
jgi:nicotinate-nucleotide adenylyltransferase